MQRLMQMDGDPVDSAGHAGRRMPYQFRHELRFQGAAIDIVVQPGCVDGFLARGRDFAGQRTCQLGQGAEAGAVAPGLHALQPRPGGAERHVMSQHAAERVGFQAPQEGPLRRCGRRHRGADLVTQMRNAFIGIRPAVGFSSDVPAPATPCRWIASPTAFIITPRSRAVTMLAGLDSQARARSIVCPAFVPAVRNSRSVLSSKVTMASRPRPAAAASTGMRGSVCRPSATCASAWIRAGPRRGSPVRRGCPTTGALPAAASVPLLFQATVSNTVVCRPTAGRPGGGGFLGAVMDRRAVEADTRARCNI